MIFNSRVQPLLTSALLKRVQGKSKLEPELKKRLNAGFVRKHGAVLLKHEFELTENCRPGDFPDLTGYEAFMNHVHMEEHVSGGAKQRLEQALLFAMALSNCLQNAHLFGKYKIIIALHGRQCSVRFHTNRTGENWLSEPLSQYDEGVLILQTEVREKAPGLQRLVNVLSAGRTAPVRDTVAETDFLLTA